LLILSSGYDSSAMLSTGNKAISSHQTQVHRSTIIQLISWLILNFISEDQPRFVDVDVIDDRTSDASNLSEHSRFQKYLGRLLGIWLASCQENWLSTVLRVISFPIPKETIADFRNKVVAL